MELFVSFTVAVMVGVVCHLIYKCLDDNDKR